MPVDVHPETLFIKGEGFLEVADFEDPMQGALCDGEEGGREEAGHE